MRKFVAILIFIASDFDLRFYTDNIKRLSLFERSVKCENLAARRIDQTHIQWPYLCSFPPRSLVSILHAISNIREN